MVSINAASFSVHFMGFSHKPISYLNQSSVVLVIRQPKGKNALRYRRKQVEGKKKNQFFFEFSEGYCGCGIVRMCKCKRWEGEGDPGLELEVLEFMRKSSNPQMFPSKRELLEAGRVDLVEAILKKGGWMSMGWDDNEPEKEEMEGGLTSSWELSNGKQNPNGCEGDARSGSELNGGKHMESSLLSDDSSLAASSSGRSLEISAEDGGGIEGILNRLERERSLSFGLDLGKNGSINHVSSGNELRTSRGVDSRRPERSEHAPFGHEGRVRSDNGSSRYHTKVLSSSLKADTWRTWSIQRAGFSDKEFEAAEIDFGQNTNGSIVDLSAAKVIAVTTDIRDPLDDTKDINSGVERIAQTDVKTRLQHLELELSSALRALRSNTDGLSEKAGENLCEDLRQLSDASEFQENEIMTSQDKLRSLRAKLAVLEGKMALAIIDAQKIVDEKQKRLDDARKALQLLRTTCIVWPNAGSEVLLAGSYDGWATQRKMERSSTGIFSLWLKLYPGKYEIKFIVDGSWKVDPLRPIVNNNGFENNLLIIT